MLRYRFSAPRAITTRTRALLARRVHPYVVRRPSRTLPRPPSSSTARRLPVTTTIPTAISAIVENRVAARTGGSTSAVRPARAFSRSRRTSSSRSAHPHAGRQEVQPLEQLLGDRRRRRGRVAVRRADPHRERRGGPRAPEHRAPPLLRRADDGERVGGEHDDQQPDVRPPGRGAEQLVHRHAHGAPLGDQQAGGTDERDAGADQADDPERRRIASERPEPDDGDRDQQHQPDVQRRLRADRQRRRPGGAARRRSDRRHRRRGADPEREGARRHVAVGARGHAPAHRVHAVGELRWERHGQGLRRLERRLADAGEHVAPSPEDVDDRQRRIRGLGEVHRDLRGGRRHRGAVGGHRGDEVRVGGRGAGAEHREHDREDRPQRDRPEPSHDRLFTNSTLVCTRGENGR